MLKYIKRIIFEKKKKPFRLPFLIKTALVLLMGIVYSLYIQLWHLQIFNCYDERVG